MVFLCASTFISNSPAFSCFVLFSHGFVVFWSGIFLFCFLFVWGFLPTFKREKEGMELDVWEAEDLGGDEGGETVLRIHYRKKTVSIITGQEYLRVEPFCEDLELMDPFE